MLFRSAGNHDAEKLSGPNFQIKNVNYQGLHLEGKNIPDTFGKNLNIRVVAIVASYDERTELLEIIPEKITMRDN